VDAVRRAESKGGGHVDFASNLIGAKQDKLNVTIMTVAAEKIKAENKFSREIGKWNGNCPSVVDRRNAIKSAHENKMESLDKRLNDLNHKMEKYAGLKSQIMALKSEKGMQGVESMQDLPPSYASVVKAEAPPAYESLTPSTSKPR